MLPEARKYLQGKQYMHSICEIGTNKDRRISFLRGNFTCALDAKIWKEVFAENVSKAVKL